MKYSLVSSRGSNQTFDTVPDAKKWFKNNVEPCDTWWINEFHLGKNGKVKNKTVRTAYEKKLGKNWRKI